MAFWSPWSHPDPASLTTTKILPIGKFLKNKAIFWEIIDYNYYSCQVNFISFNYFLNVGLLRELCSQLTDNRCSLNADGLFPRQHLSFMHIFKVILAFLFLKIIAEEVGAINMIESQIKIMKEASDILKFFRIRSIKLLIALKWRLW